MKKFLFALPIVLALLFVVAPRAVVAQDNESDLEKLRKELREKIDREIDKFKQKLKESIDELLRRFAENEQTPPTTTARKPWLGFRLRTEEGVNGLRIIKFYDKSPALKAGMKEGDIIKSFGEVVINELDDLHKALEKYKVGQKVGVGIERDGQHIVIELELMTKEQALKSAPKTEKSKRAWIGISLDTTYHGTGIKIHVEKDSPADKAGLRNDDVIISINGEPIESRFSFGKIWKKIKVGQTIKIVALRGTEKKEFSVKVLPQPDREKLPLPPTTKKAIPGLPQVPGGVDLRTRILIARLNQQAIEAMQTGDYDEAIEYLNKILKLNPNSDVALYNLACIYSLRKEKEKALEYLKKSIIAGFIDWKHISQDTDLDNIRDMPEYKKLMSNKKQMLKMMAQTRVDAIRKAYGDSFHFMIDTDDMLIFATEYPQDVLEYLKNKLLTYAKAQWKYLFDYKPDYYITIIIPSREKFRELIPNRAIGGFYNPLERTLFASELGFTLVHEFTHALHFADLDKRGIMHNIWFTEGLATCFENSYLKDGVPTPIDNARLYTLQRYIQANRIIKLSALMRLNQAQFMRIAGLAYAMSRYFVVWLWKNGNLKKVYDAYCKTFARDPSGILAVTDVLGKSIEKVNEDWLKWVKSLPPYKGFTGKNRPFIGIRMREIMGGIKIEEAVEGYPAQKAGMKSGDVITHIDGERILSISDLVNFLMTHKPGDKVKFTVKRGEKSLTIELTLVKRPEGK